MLVSFFQFDQLILMIYNASLFVLIPVLKIFAILLFKSLELSTNSWLVLNIFEKMSQKFLLFSLDKPIYLLALVLGSPFFLRKNGAMLKTGVCKTIIR